MGDVILEETVMDADSIPDTAALNDVDNTHDNIDLADALGTLSNLKKYKINKQCTQNLYEIGWEFIGDNISEERHETREMVKMERLQIDEAVQYHI